MTLDPTPVVFVGPSASRLELATILPTARFLPPAARGDLYRAREQGASILLVLDGTFLHGLAMSPREVVDVLRDGAMVLGAASMGAIRAAECWPAGMLGIGMIARLFRLGWLKSDDEVAVATDPDDGFAARSVALVNVRYAVSKARRLSLVDQCTAGAIVEAAKKLYFTERLWPLIIRGAGLVDLDHELECNLASFNLKHRDSLTAAHTLARALGHSPDLAQAHGRRHQGRFNQPERYPGHDPSLGYAPHELKVRLTQWLFGSGRYQPYVWALASGEPELRSIAQGAVVDAAASAESRRDALAAILSRWMTHVDRFAPMVISELEFMDEFDAELMRWHAVYSLGSNVFEPQPEVLDRVRQELAIAHGLVNWDMLRGEVVDDRLFGAIPLAWIEEACLVLARARTYAGGSTR